MATGTIINVNKANSGTITSTKGTLESWSVVRRSGNTVMLTFRITLNQNISAFNEIAVIPSGFRPSQSLNLNMPCQVGSSIVNNQVQILDTGVIRTASALTSGQGFGFTVTYII